MLDQLFGGLRAESSEVACTTQKMDKSYDDCADAHDCCCLSKRMHALGGRQDQGPGAKEYILLKDPAGRITGRRKYTSSRSFEQTP
jgi:hypothetical protein